MFNKKGNEVFSWATGLIMIVLIILVTFLFYYFGNFSSKNSISMYSDLNSSELQRVVVYVLSSDFNSSSKGEMLSKIYSDVKESSDYGGNYGFNPQIIGTLLTGLPSYYSDYSFIASRNSLTIKNAVYLACQNCEYKYNLFGVERNVKK